jgi:hypothetical protein
MSIPLILNPGFTDEDTAVGLMKQGATDYVLKARLSALGTGCDSRPART